jgi:hypothetical protein
MTPLKQQILDRVNEFDWVSFAELNRIDGFSNTENGLAMCHSKFTNVVLWVNLSSAAGVALTELQTEGKIYWEPGSLTSYLVDGVTLNMPLVKRAKNYVKPHWLPVFWRPGPLKKSK